MNIGLYLAQLIQNNEKSEIRKIICILSYIESEDINADICHTKIVKELIFIRKMMKICSACCGDDKSCMKVMPSPLKAFALNLHNTGMVGYMQVAGHTLLKSRVRCRQNGRTGCHLFITVFLSARGGVTSGLEGKQLSEPPQRPRFWVSLFSGCEGENCFDDKTL